MKFIKDFKDFDKVSEELKYHIDNGLGFGKFADNLNDILMHIFLFNIQTRRIEIQWQIYCKIEVKNTF